jgi:hypothetical protein
VSKRRERFHPHDDNVSRWTSEEATAATFLFCASRVRDTVIHPLAPCEKKSGFMKLAPGLHAGILPVLENTAQNQDDEFGYDNGW